MTASALVSEGFKDVKLCIDCYWETVGFWNGDGDRLLELVREEIEIQRDNHGSDRHSDAIRSKIETLEDILKNTLMFDGNVITTDASAGTGRQLLDEFGPELYRRLSSDSSVFMDFKFDRRELN